MSVYSDNLWADEMDIDLDTLMLEKFHTGTHLRLLKKHERRVAKFQQLNRWRAFDGHLDEVGKYWRDKEKLRRERISATKQGERYNFSDELIQIAMRSLDANDTLREVRV